MVLFKNRLYKGDASGKEHDDNIQAESPQLSTACLALTTIAVCSTLEVTGMGKAHLRNIV